jgi:leader peptidase (prepilin peptidase)/N-methyltransferase
VNTGHYHLLFAGFAFLFGAVVGSFLNVCIYRMPRGLSVNKPRRSFCPSCEKQIPWFRNLPLLSWLLLRGRCATCGAKIPFRYFLVEALTGALFLATWWRAWGNGTPELFLPLAIFLSLSVIATFIDFEHTIIPDEITLGGAAAGLLVSVLLPSLHAQETWWMGALLSLGGAAVGYGSLRFVVEAGKLAFGKKKIEFDPPAEFSVEFGEQPALRVGEESLSWDDIFSRPSDRLELTCPEAVVAGERRKDALLRFYFDRLEVGGAKHPLEGLAGVSGRLAQAVIPREAMGLGDVKYMAAIGAFLGWQAVLFTVVAASISGTLVALLSVALGHREWSEKIPFGPYLALGAAAWIFFGPELVEAYFALYPAPRAY